MPGPGEAREPRGVTGVPEDRPGSPDQVPPDAVDLTADPAADAPADALARAREAARARGLSAGPVRRRGRRRSTAPRELTASGTDGRDPVLLGDQMSRLLARSGWDQHVRSAEVVQRWAGIVGPGIAAHTTALRHEAAVLTVQAHSTAWATQLRLLEPSLIGALAEALGEGVVVQLEVKGPHAPSWSRGRFRVPGRGPRDTYG